MKRRKKEKEDKKEKKVRSVRLQKQVSVGKKNTFRLIFKTALQKIDFERRNQRGALYRGRRNIKKDRILARKEWRAGRTSQGE